MSGSAGAAAWKASRTVRGCPQRRKRKSKAKARPFVHGRHKSTSSAVWAPLALLIVGLPPAPVASSSIRHLQSRGAPARSAAVCASCTAPPLPCCITSLTSLRRRPWPHSELDRCSPSHAPSSLSLAAPSLSPSTRCRCPHPPPPPLQPRCLCAPLRPPRRPSCRRRRPLPPPLTTATATLRQAPVAMAVTTAVRTAAGLTTAFTSTSRPGGTKSEPSSSVSHCTSAYQQHRIATSTARTPRS